MQGRAAPKGSLRDLLASPAVLAIVVVNFVNHWGYFIYLNWMPTYFYQVLGEYAGLLMEPMAEPPLYTVSVCLLVRMPVYCKDNSSMGFFSFRLFHAKKKLKKNCLFR